MCCMRAQQFETSADHRISVATRQRDIIVIVSYGWGKNGEAVGLLAMRQGGKYLQGKNLG